MNIYIIERTIMSKEEVKLTEEELKEEAKSELATVQTLESQLSELELALSQDERFQNFLTLQKTVADKSREVMKKLETQMIDNGIKSIKIDTWGTLTIVDAKKWTYNTDELPKKFIKKAVDTTAINNYFKLSNKLPKGASYEPNQYIKATPKKQKED